MIEKKFFMGEMTKIFEQFGSNKFSARKIDLIFLAIRNLDDQELSHVVDCLIGDSKFAPSLTDFKDKARQFLSDRGTRAAVDCSTCGGGGVVSVRKKTGEVGCYAFQCHCENGLQYPKFQPWKDYYTKFFTRQVVPISLSMEFHGVEGWEKYKR